MFNSMRFLLVAFILLLILIACEGGRMPEKASSFTSPKDIPDSTWENLSNMRIYFGHQSVGFNIVDGLKDVIKENPQIKLNIVETNDLAIFTTPVFAHSKVGKNMDPLSKINGFAELMGQGVGGRADFAFFKFCYVDVTMDVDIQKIFRHYKGTLEGLKKRYPETTFIHVTIPLTVIQTGPKVWIKKIIGKPMGGYADNIKRNQFNEMLKKEYEGKEPIFDMADIESTFPDGKRVSFTESGKTFYAMVPDYTDDGEHLNEKGRKIVASQMLILLARLPGKVRGDF